MTDNNKSDPRGVMSPRLLAGMHFGQLPLWACLGVVRDLGGQWWLVDTTALLDHQAGELVDRIELDNADDAEWHHYSVYVAWQSTEPPIVQGPADWEQSVLVHAPNPIVAMQSARQNTRLDHPGFVPYCLIRLPALPLDPCECNDDVCYQGCRDESGRYRVLKDGIELLPKRSLLVRSWNAAGFAWGYRGAGPAQLALALLLDVTEDVTLSRLLTERYRKEVVETLPLSWTMCAREIKDWVEGTKAR